MDVQINGDIYTNVQMVRHVYQKDNNKSFWLFLYFKPGTTEYNHNKNWDYLPIEYNVYKDTITIIDMPSKP